MKVNSTNDVPDGADEDAAIVKVAAADDGESRRTLDGVTVMPGGTEVGVTRRLELGGQAEGTADTETVPDAPPGLSSMLVGETSGVKSGMPTFTVKLVDALRPKESSARTLIVLGPGDRPGPADTVKETVWAGGSGGTERDVGVTVIPAGRFGKKTKGYPE
jgi:hypothetical protein